MRVWDVLYATMKLNKVNVQNNVQNLKFYWDCGGQLEEQMRVERVYYHYNILK